MLRNYFVVAVVLIILILAPMTFAQEGEENTVEVSLVEFQIQMPNMIPAGPTTFEVSNDGTVEHNFEIEGQGIEEVFETNLQPGETRTMQVDLQPGEYTVYCPVGNHREQGMELTLTVTEADEVAEATTEAMVEAAATPQATPPPPALPQTGGVISSWSGILLLTVGALLLLIGGLGFTFIRRRAS